jgi:hypothetical protein
MLGPFLFELRCEAMTTFIGFLLRLFLLLAGLLFAASLAVAAVLGLALWGARAAWARVTGKPVSPFIVRVDPRGAFRRASQPAQPRSRTPRADAVPSALDGDSVTDVEPKLRES